MDTYNSRININGYKIMKSCQSPDIRFPSMASFLFWQLKQRKGPSQGRGFPVLGAPSCTGIPSPGLIST